MGAGVEFLVSVQGKGATGVPVTIEGQEANRILYLDGDAFVVSVDNTVVPPRMNVVPRNAIANEVSSSPVANTIALRDNSADLYARYFNGNCRIGGSNSGGRFAVVSESTVGLFSVSYAGGEVNMGFFGQSESTVPIVDISAITDYTSLRSAFLQLVNELSRIGLVQIID